MPISELDGTYLEPANAGSSPQTVIATLSLLEGAVLYIFRGVVVIFMSLIAAYIFIFCHNKYPGILLLFSTRVCQRAGCCLLLTESWAPGIGDTRK